MGNLLQMIIFAVLVVMFFIDFILYYINFYRMNTKQKIIGAIPFGMFFIINKITTN